MAEQKLQQMQQIKRQIKIFKKGEDKKNSRINEMYRAKFSEVSLKFNNFVADVNQDIEHGRFYDSLRLEYGIDVGSGEKVQFQDLLKWINCSVRPTDIQEASKVPSGFFESVIQLEADQPTLKVVRDADYASPRGGSPRGDRSPRRGLAEFLCSPGGGQSFALDIDQVFAPLFIKPSKCYIDFRPFQTFPLPSVLEMLHAAQEIPTLLNIEEAALTEQEIDDHLHFLSKLKHEMENIAPAKIFQEDFFSDRKSSLANEPLNYGKDNKLVAVHAFRINKRRSTALVERSMDHFNQGIVL